jgi:predicted MPP superfamily phosphohydrolase
VKRWLLFALVLPAAFWIWAFAIEPASLRTREYEIRPPRWKRACDGLRVAVLADLHVGSPWNGRDRLAEIAAETNAARPDLVLLAGDYVIQGVRGGRFVPPDAIAETLRTIAAPLGVWAVLGNHDWWLDGPRVRSALEGAGIRVLEDAAAEVGRGECRFWLAGFGDFWESRHAWVSPSRERTKRARSSLSRTTPISFRRSPPG